MSDACAVPSCDDQTANGLCGRHTYRLRLALSELPRLYVELNIALADPSDTTPVGSKVTTSKAPPAPINIAARALAEDMVNAVIDAETKYRRTRGWSPTPSRGREGPQLVRSADFCARVLADLLRYEFGISFGVELLRIANIARVVLGQVRLVHRLPAPCPTCDCLALERADGADRVTCCYCGRTFTEDEYARLVLVLAGDIA